MNNPHNIDDEPARLAARTLLAAVLAPEIATRQRKRAAEQHAAEPRNRAERRAAARRRKPQLTKGSTK